MAFVKLDPRILRSTLWDEEVAVRLVFITALCMAEPWEFQEPTQAYNVFSEEPLDDLVVRPGWYGFIRGSGNAIVHQARVNPEDGRTALEKLSQRDPMSTSNQYDGRRIVRVTGGYVVLNFFKYRDRDDGAAERMRRLRDRRNAQSDGNSGDVTGSDRNVRPNNPERLRLQSAEDRVQKEEKSKANMHNYALPDWVPAESWNGFVEMRKKIRKPLTDRGADLVVKKLENFRSQGYDVGEILDASTQNCWAGVFEPKVQNSRASASGALPAGYVPASESIRAEREARSAS